MSVAGRSIGAGVRVTKRIRLAPGDLVFSRLHTQNGAFAFADQEYHATGTFVPLLISEAKVDKCFLFWALHVGIPSLSASDTVGRETYKTSDILALEIPLPPLAEQRRLVARIEALSARIAEARSLRLQAAEEAEALFDQGRATIFQTASKASGARLEQLAVLERGKFSHRPRNDPRFFGGNHPWIQIAEIERSNKFIREWSVTLNDEGLAISKKFPKGTVVISIAATIGATGILAFDCCVPDSIVGVTPRDGTDSEFLYHYLGFVRTHLESVAPQSAQKNINLQILAPLPAPKLPLFEQRRIVEYLDGLHARVDTLKRLQAETATELVALLPSVLDRVFRGEL